MTMVWSAWDDDDDRLPHTPEHWAEVRDFVGELFNEIDRPNEWLLRLSIEVRGDESGGTSWSFAAGLTAEQRRALMIHAAEELMREAQRPNAFSLAPPHD